MDKLFFFDFIVVPDLFCGRVGCHRLPVQLDAIRIVNQSVHDAVGESRVADLVVSMGQQATGW